MRALAEPSTYAAAVEHLAAHPERYGAEPLPLLRLRDRQAQFSRELARAVASGSYELGPMRERLAQVGGKERRLYAASLVDTVVLTALARALAERVEPLLSPRVFSYRKGRSGVGLVGELAAFVERHRRERPDPKQRGLYVVRADVSAYGESIPVHERSTLWPALRRAAGEGAFWLVEQAVRPVVLGLDGSSGRRERGVPTGSPIQPLICNLYLSPLDEALACIAGAFYGRFGDDLLFVHPDAAVAQQAAELLESRLAELELGLSAKKRKNLYFTSAARASREWPEASPAQFVEYLGARVGFRGHVGLSHRRYRRLLLALRSRIEHSSILLGPAPPRERMELLCGVVRAALDPTSATADAAAAILRDVVDDPDQLRQLDYVIGLQIAEHVARRRGPRAFRDLSYRELRQAGLWSALHTAHVRPRASAGS